MDTRPSLIDVEDLTVEFSTRDGKVAAVRDVSFSLARGETLGIVGESGSGKSVTSYALMRILDANGTIAHGELTYGGIDLRQVRGTGPLVTIHQPDVPHFKAQLKHLRTYADLRGDRMGEIAVQLGDGL